jgi:hypothetical protein
MNVSLTKLLLDSVIAVIVFTQITGCATTAQLEILNDPGRYRVFAPPSDQIVTNARIPAVTARHFPYGEGWFAHFSGEEAVRRNMDISVEWSNGYRENILWTWKPERGKHYLLLAIELNAGQQEKDANLEIKTLGDELLVSSIEKASWSQTFGQGIAAGLAPLGFLLLPVTLYFLITKVTERPFAGCCFVWIADVETGKTVAGESPPGMKLALPQTDRVKAGK